MNPKILIDTNVWLDVLLDRKPHVVDSARALSLAQSRGATLCLGATTVTTLSYFIQKHTDPKSAGQAIKRLLDSHEVAAVTGEVLRSALNAGFDDFEDAVLHEAACRAGVDLVLTRNAQDFESGDLAVYTPTEYLAARFTPSR